MKFRVFVAIVATVLALSVGARAQVGPQISSVQMMGPSILYPNGQLRVVLIGTPGGVATFDLPGAATAVPMHETAPGRYEGKLYMPNVPPIEGPRVVGHLSLNGILVEREADNSLGAVPGPVLVGASHPFVTIISPQSQENVVRDFVVRGYTVPHALVTVNATLRHRQVGDIITNHPRHFVMTGRSDGAGRFAIPVHLIGEVDRHQRLDLQVSTTDPASGVTSKNVKMRIGTGGD